MTFSELLRARRSELNLTQNELSDLLGLRVQTIINWENYISEPDINDKKLIKHISYRLQVPKRIIRDILSKTQEYIKKEKEIKIEEFKFKGTLEKKKDFLKVKGKITCKD